MYYLKYINIYLPLILMTRYNEEKKKDNLYKGDNMKKKITEGLNINP